MTLRPRDDEREGATDDEASGGRVAGRPEPPQQRYVGFAAIRRGRLDAKQAAVERLRAVELRRRGKTRPRRRLRPARAMSGVVRALHQAEDAAGRASVIARRKR